MSGGGVQVQNPNPVTVARAGLAAMRTQLQQIAQATCQVNLVKSSAAPVLKNTRRLDMTTRLASEFKDAISANLIQMANDALQTPDGVAQFNFQAFADGRLAAMPTNQFQKVSDWFGKFPAPDAVQPLTQAADFLPSLKFVETSLVWAPNGECVRAFRKSSAARVAKKDGIIANLTGAGYDYVDASTSLIFDMHVDFFIWDGIIYAPSYKNLESILNFREITHSVALGVCNTVFAMLPVTDAAALQAAIIDKGARHLNKVAGLKNKAHIPLLDMTRIQAVITKAHLPLTIVNVNGVQTLHVDVNDADHVRAYLHVLSDDYVESMMTALHYIGIEKEQI